MLFLLAPLKRLGIEIAIPFPNELEIFIRKGRISMYSPDLIVFSHLRWDFVYQRPQHILSRMARMRRIFFIEEPIYEQDITPYWEQYAPQPHVLVCRLHTPIGMPGFHADHGEVFLPKLQELCAEHRIAEYLIWMYTPMALPFAQSLDPQLVIYDCMDELSAFLYAPQHFLPRRRPFWNGRILCLPAAQASSVQSAIGTQASFVFRVVLMQFTLAGRVIVSKPPISVVSLILAWGTMASLMSGSIRNC